MAATAAAGGNQTILEFMAATTNMNVAASYVDRRGRPGCDAPMHVKGGLAKWGAVDVDPGEIARLREQPRTDLVEVVDVEDYFSEEGGGAMTTVPPLLGVVPIPAKRQRTRLTFSFNLQRKRSREGGYPVSPQ